MLNKSSYDGGGAGSNSVGGAVGITGAEGAVAPPPGGTVLPPPIFRAAIISIKANGCGRSVTVATWVSVLHLGHGSDPPEMRECRQF